MDTKQLRQKILDLAIRGKLVSQDKSEGDAKDLLNEIKNEKAKLIKEGKIKKEKPLPEITDDEKPFEIPGGWCWCRLKECCLVVMGQSPDSDFINNHLSGVEFHQGKICFGDKFLNKSDNYASKITKIAPKNSILLCVRAPVGIVNITDREICIGRGLCAIKPFHNMLIDFWFYWILCQRENFEKKATGTTFKAISIDDVSNQLIPLPPLAEQKRIVDKINKLFAQIDIIEEALKDEAK